MKLIIISYFILLIAIFFIAPYFEKGSKMTIYHYGGETMRGTVYVWGKSETRENIIKHIYLK